MPPRNSHPRTTTIRRPRDGRAAQERFAALVRQQNHEQRTAARATIAAATALLHGARARLARSRAQLAALDTISRPVPPAHQPPHAAD